MSLKCVHTAALLALAALVSAGCGGGGDGGAAEPQPMLPAPAPEPAPPITPPGPLPAPSPSPAPLPPPAPQPPVDAACSAETQRAGVREWLQDQYYWDVQQPGSAGESAADLPAYFNSLLWQPTDRYSYAQSSTTFNQLFTDGTRIGYGYTLAWADTARTRLRVRSVEPRSPVALAGVRRGDTVVSIGGFDTAAIAAGLLTAVNVPGISRNFRVRDASGAERSVDVVSALYPLTPVEAHRTFDLVRSGVPVRVGYLAYTQFVGYSRPALGEAFRAFAAAQVSEVILDLRYNGGGSVQVARDVASMLGGARTDGQLFTYLRFNARHPERDISIPFTGGDALPAPPLAGLSRVVVLTSGETASASELLINGLKPFMEVVTIGATTFGKPYGFVPRENCGITYNAVNFESFNGKGEGGFTAGFAPTCAAADDTTRELGDPMEGRTRAALEYLQTGRCTAQAPQSLGEGPARAAVFGEPVRGGLVLE